MCIPGHLVARLLQSPVTQQSLRFKKFECHLWKGILITIRPLHSYPKNQENNVKMVVLCKCQIVWLCFSQYNNTISPDFKIHSYIHIALDFFSVGNIVPSNYYKCGFSSHRGSLVPHAGWKSVALFALWFCDAAGAAVGGPGGGTLTQSSWSLLLSRVPVSHTLSAAFYLPCCVHRWHSLALLFLHRIRGMDHVPHPKPQDTKHRFQL